MGIAEELVGGKSAAFPNIGTRVGGRVLSSDIRQATEFKTHKPLTWDDGKPKKQAVIVVSTPERDPQDPTDNGDRAIYVNLWGQKKAELIRAVRAAGDDDVRPDGHFEAVYVADQPSDAGNDAKVFEFTYRKPGGIAGELVDQTLAQQGGTVAAPPATAAPAAPPAPPAAATPPPPPVANPFAGVAADTITGIQGWMRAGWTDEQLASPAGAAVAAGVSREALAAIRAAL